ncbi:assembly factor CBP4 [Coccidioides immitis RS]|uniref:Assembly factor CBP4 n=3 Tax=Coccidioides immitis TaxID=5501 RepID=CBP4_COCIM|nr:assembly factor CBP4 [Coccidioides immitis RS]Q1DHX9.1 RecName: Full=Assembly factor CBP4; AltName: Full=Cytochrome b mRNA-processing protein 4 [Coccidioides immitis RS]KMP09437.1 hypothetical protein CIRG_09607 [Coccidioides immitis RMSCC 2394]KMU88526.1 hypothetical protein CIHG_06326 [Coccidioides immitis H538.4]TPX20256.1 assembly factor cbp4 [Coccidioides immitis]EAS27479.3 assembly factor CBP4 [Coccidioides immitis RS]
MGSAWKWTKMITVGAVVCVGGPMFVNYVRPTEEELFQRFNPELQKRNLANRDKRQQEFDEFVTKLKEYSKSDKPIWVVAKEAEELQKKQQREAALAAKKAAAETPTDKPTQ